MKKVFINCSMRKNGNTAMALKESLRGAKEDGAEVRYYDLADYDFKGCRGCLACKRKDVERKCYIKDGLTPILEDLQDANAVIIGAPIYFGNPSADFYALIERFRFPIMSYDDYSSYLKGKIDIGLVFTMNATDAHYETLYQEKMESFRHVFNVMNGKVEILPITDTLQTGDYSRYNMASFDEQHKKEMRERKFPDDLEKAYKLGETLGR